MTTGQLMSRTMQMCLAAAERYAARGDHERAAGAMRSAAHSYRGYYSDLAFERGEGMREAGALLQECRAAMGRVFEGYKGGDYVMGERTPVWVANYGCCGDKLMALRAGGWWKTKGNDVATVIEIVKAHLVANGFDGLVQTDAECGCLCDELAPCGGDFSSCEPAYRGANIDQMYSPDEWAMYRTKERARESVEEVKARNYERPGMRECEFCGCKTNAKLRACCHSGNEADRSKAADIGTPNRG